MYSARRWSVRHANGLNSVYHMLQRVLVALHPVFEKIGYQRLDRPVLAAEKLVKGFLFDSQSCGMCALSDTGMSCPMNCPKSLRNGPCGGVRPDGHCEVKPQMKCVWVEAWDGSQRIRGGEDAIAKVQPPVDVRLAGTSAWLREVRAVHAQRVPRASTPPTSKS